MWVKYHFKTDQGIRNLPACEAGAMEATNPDHAIQDLYNAIAEGDSPSWTVYVQVCVRAEWVIDVVSGSVCIVKG